MSGRTEGGATGRRTSNDVHNDNELQARTPFKRPIGRRARWRAPAEPSRASGDTGVSEKKIHERVRVAAGGLKCG